jgi:hypothetical protein
MSGKLSISRLWSFATWLVLLLAVMTTLASSASANLRGGTCGAHSKNAAIESRSVVTPPIVMASGRSGDGSARNLRRILLHRSSPHDSHFRVTLRCGQDEDSRPGLTQIRESAPKRFATPPRIVRYRYDATQLLRVSHFGMATKSVGNAAPRTFSSTDPLVGDAANAIELAMPGRILKVNTNIPMLKVRWEIFARSTLTLGK